MPTIHVAEAAALMPHDLPLPKVHSLGSDEGSLTLPELTVLCTSLSKKVESLESDLKKTKQTYGAAYTKLVIKVKKLEHQVKLIKARRKVRLVISDDEDDLEDPSKQGRKIAQIDKDEGITLWKKKSPKPKARGISFQDLEEVVRREVISPPVSKISTKDNGKAIMIEPEKPSKKKDQIQIDKELALRLHAKLIRRFLEPKQVAQEETSKAAIYEEMDNIQAMIEADEQLATRVQAEEQELYSIEEKSRLLAEMITEMKRNMGGYKHNQLKGKSYEEIQKLFDKTYKHVNSFVPMESDNKDKDSEKKAGGSRKKTLTRKRVGEKQSEESAKRQKIEDGAEKEELRAHLDIISGDDVVIIRANGSTKSYKIFTEMLDDFDRQDVLDLYRLVKERFETTSLEGYDRLLWGYLITVFEPSKDDEIWKAQQDYTLISWRSFDLCGIYVLIMNTGIAIHILVEKTYPLIQEMLSRMLSRKLEVDNEREDCWELRASTKFILLVQLSTAKLKKFCTTQIITTSTNWTDEELNAFYDMYGLILTDIQEKDKKKAKSKQFQARSRKGQSQKSAKQENTT
ncbi:hypothetical protein Tco_0371616 [Tanacetum coccineum]